MKIIIGVAVAVIIVIIVVSVVKGTQKWLETSPSCPDPFVTLDARFICDPVTCFLCPLHVTYRLSTFTPLLYSTHLFCTWARVWMRDSIVYIYILVVVDFQRAWPYGLYLITSIQCGLNKFWRRAIISSHGVRNWLPLLCPCIERGTNHFLLIPHDDPDIPPHIIYPLLNWRYLYL